MTRFGRFDCGKKNPIETYQGDRIELDRGYVKILRGSGEFMEPALEEVVAIFQLTEGQSVRAVPARIRTKKRRRKKKKKVTP